MMEKLFKKSVKDYFLGGAIVIVLAMVISLLPMSSITAHAFDPLPEGSKEFSALKIGDRLEYGVYVYSDDVFYMFYDYAGHKAFFSTDNTDVVGFDKFTVNYDDRYYGCYCTSMSTYYTVVRDARLPQEDSDDNDDDSSDDDSSDDDGRPAPPSPSESAQRAILQELDTQLAHIDSIPNGQVIIDGKDLINSLPNAAMKKIAENPNANVFFKFIYNGVQYTTAIPAGATIDTSIDYYGPLYMMNVFPTMSKTEAGPVPYIPGA